MLDTTFKMTHHTQFCALNTNPMLVLTISEETTRLRVVRPMVTR
jgi:hypothetical protein